MSAAICPFCDSGLVWKDCPCDWARKATVYGFPSAVQGFAKAQEGAKMAPAPAAKPDKMLLPSKRGAKVAPALAMGGAKVAPSTETEKTWPSIPTSVLAWREERGMSQLALCQALEIASRTMKRAEALERSGQSSEMMMLLALVGLDALGLTKRKDGE